MYSRGYLLSDVFKYHVCYLVCLKISTLFNIFNWDVACLGTWIWGEKSGSISTIENQHFSLDRFSPPSILIVFYSRDVSLMPIFDDHRRDSCRTFKGLMLHEKLPPGQTAPLVHCRVLFFLGGGPGRFIDFTNQLPFWMLVRQHHLNSWNENM